jgi:hypothetical protein
MLLELPSTAHSSSHRRRGREHNEDVVETVGVSLVVDVGIAGVVE